MAYRVGVCRRGSRRCVGKMRCQGITDKNGKGRACGAEMLAHQGIEGMRQTDSVAWRRGHRALIARDVTAREDPSLEEAGGRRKREGSPGGGGPARDWPG